MRTQRLAIVILAALLALGVSTTANAFHSGGVAECGGCHSMHSPAPVTPGTDDFLLVGSDQSSTCLSCHQHAGDTGPSSYHISTADADMPVGSAPKQRTPGGDFGWLKKTYTFVVRGETIVEDGATHGHNIVASDFGYAAVGTALSPGGTYPEDKFQCNSCHDPHGKYRRNTAGLISTTGQAIKASGSYNGTGNEPDGSNAVGVYRLLAGNLYTTKGTVPAAAFPGVPAAKVTSSYNQTEATSQIKVAYGVAATNGHSTWGNWCGACHGAMHSMGNYVHPVDQSMSALLTNYNTYVKSGDMTGSQPTSFLSLAPFVKNSGDYAVLAAEAKNAPTAAGPTDSDQVSCVSCHRAHAGGFEYMLRWEQEYEFITKNGTYGGTDTTPTDAALHRGRTNAEKVASYYDRPATVFANYQRVLCNKCHAKD